MPNVKLQLFQVSKSMFTASFYARGVDVLDNSGNFSDYRLFFSNNPAELISAMEGKLKETGSPFYIDFKRDPHSQGYFIPEAKKLCPKFDFYLLVCFPPRSIQTVDFFFEYK